MTDARAPRGAQGRIGAVINGKWQIDARLGSGGMATVYAATHRNGARAAIKMLHANLSRDPSTRARFLREGYVANAVGHPGVVGVLDDGVAEDGAAFLVLELLEGETVEARRLAKGGQLPVDLVLAVADEALEALGAAHKKGIVHRDVKPDNVFLTDEGQTKLLDFGLARMKELNAEATQTGVTLGTPEFMPPEQAMGMRDQIDARTDLWALGATLYTLLTGRHVHDAQTIHEQLIASATRRANPIRKVLPSLPPPIAQVIDRSLEIEMSDRWQTAEEMRAALRDARSPRSSRRPHDSETITNAAPAPRRSIVDPNEERLATNTTEAFAISPERGIDFDETFAAPPPVSRRSYPDAPPVSHRSNRPPARSNRPPAPPPSAPVSHRSNRPPHPQATARMRPGLEPPASRRSRPQLEEMMTPPPVSRRPSRPAPEELYAPISNRRSFPAPEELADPNATFPPNSLPPPSIQPMREPYPSVYPSGPVSTRAPVQASTKPVLAVFVVLIALCAAMGAYVLSRSQ